MIDSLLQASLAHDLACSLLAPTGNFGISGRFIGMIQARAKSAAVDDARLGARVLRPLEALLELMEGCRPIRNQSCGSVGNGIKRLACLLSLPDRAGNAIHRYLHPAIR